MRAKPIATSTNPHRREFDAALFAAVGIPAVCFGPGDIARAHSATEWVELAQLQQATDVLTRVCRAWGR